MFHDVQAHVPFLMNKDYANFMHDLGILGYEIIKDERGLGPELISHNLKRLQNFAWWTYEFGLVKKTQATQIVSVARQTILIMKYTGPGLFRLMMKRIILLNVQKAIQTIHNLFHLILKM